MSTLTRINATVTDTNHRLRGTMRIEVEFLHGSPMCVVHDGAAYFRTGKTGTHIATGQATLEMATEDDARLWITHSGETVWED